MSSRVASISIACLLAGCETPPTPLRDVGPIDATDRREVPRSMSFLLTHFEHATGPAQDGTVNGLDLDDRVTIGDPETRDCRDRHADRRSPRGEDGVDNQVVADVLPYVLAMGGELTGDPQTDYDAPIVSGERLHVVRVSDIDDPSDDPDVRVEVLAVERPGCGGEACPLGEVAVDEVFLDRGMSLADVRGTITDGHVRFSLASYFVEGPSVPTPLHDVVVDLEIDAQGGANGALGGGLDIEEMVSHAAALMPIIDPSGYDAYYERLRQFSDLSPSASDPTICDRVSMAFELEAVRVVVPR